MSEVDYQMALLLQHQFEQETKNVGQAIHENEGDYILARELQEQFETESVQEIPRNNLVYDDKSSKNKSKDSTKSLTDPSWEIVDPTPDVHILFVAFNERFFWDKLFTVTVSWSKRMTTCAGICSYNGRGGECKIALSEPLLKLRPRKDLVETLLHEMIHAFLFVTHNNKDRDGHGPEFHKHMHRINQESGTNITVYHDFHDEVKLYQQHWWRCDGPCQKWKPYFGMVRRATNKAPGPNDRWWGEHSRNCGGTYIKVKEPEKNKPQTKPTNPKNKKEPEDPGKSDIRNFFPTTSPKTTATKNISSTSTSVNTTNPNNVFKTPATKPLNDNTKSANIIGFKDLDNRQNIKGGVKNTSSTIVINKKPTTSTVTSGNSTQIPVNVKDNIKPDTGPGPILSNTASTSSGDYSAVRNHWLNKFPTDKVPLGKRKSLDTESHETPAKIAKTDTNNRATTSATNISNNISDNKNTFTPDLVECPICSKQFPMPELNAHIDSCLENSEKDTKECIICNQEIKNAEYESHVISCSEKHFDTQINKNPSSGDKETCPNSKNIDNEYEKTINSTLNSTEKSINESDLSTSSFYNPSNNSKASSADLTADDLEASINDLLNDISSESTSSAHDHWSPKVSTSKVIKKPPQETFDKEKLIDDLSLIDCVFCKQKIHIDDLLDHQKTCISASDVTKSKNQECPVCYVKLAPPTYDRHVEKCLKDMLDSMNGSPSKETQNDTIPCLACGKKIVKKDLNSHLEDCMSMTSVFDASQSFVDDEEEENEKEVTVKKYNCPFCMKLVTEVEMNSHIDKCLNISDV